MDKSFGYMLIKCMTILVTVLFQFVLLFQIDDTIIVYILSNISVISGYIIDMYSMKYNYREKRRFINFCMLNCAISCSLALSDIMFIVNYEQELKYLVGSFIHSFVYKDVPVYTFVSLIFYFILNILVLIDKEREEYK